MLIPKKGISKFFPFWNHGSKTMVTPIHPLPASISRRWNVWLRGNLIFKRSRGIFALQTTNARWRKWSFLLFLRPKHWKKLMRYLALVVWNRINKWQAFWRRPMEAGRGCPDSKERNLKMHFQVSFFTIGVTIMHPFVYGGSPAANDVRWLQ
jgi:hypothetical protein